MSDFEVMPDFLSTLEANLRRQAGVLHAEVMPDYLSALERDLRLRAAATASRTRRQPARWRRPVFALAFVASIIAQALMVDAPVVRESPAFGSPPILEVPTVDVPRRLLKQAPLADVRTDAAEARRIELFGGVAYLIGGGDVWCLYLPDPAAADPERAGAATCVGSADFFRIGLAAWYGRRYVAVLPGGVEWPTLKHADGRSETLEPSDHGVVAVDHMSPGDRVVLHGSDGRTRVDRNYALDATEADSNNTNTNTTDDEEG